MAFTKILKKGGNKYAIRVEGYRDENGKVKHKYLEYLGKVGADGKIITREPDTEKVYQFGFPCIVDKALKELDLEKALGSHTKEVSFLITMHLCNPGSLNKMIKRGGLIDPSLITTYSRKSLEASIDFLEEHKELIEQKIYEKIKEECKEKSFFYDLTAIALNGIRSRYAEVGYPEFAPQLNVGLCIEAGSGFPVFHEVYEGNLSHKTTLKQIMERLRSFDRESTVLVFDAGVFGEGKNLEDALGEDLKGFDVITRVPLTSSIKSLAISNKTTSIRDVVCLSNSKIYAREVIKEKGRLVVCFNERVKVSVRERRYEEVLKALEKKKKGKPIKEGLKKYLVKEGGVWVMNLEEMEEAEKYDGLYVLYCSDAVMRKEEIVTKYFDKDLIEKSFCKLKSTIEVKPIRFQTDQKIRGHIMLCHLSYLVAAYIEKKLREKQKKDKKEKKHTMASIKELLANVYNIHSIKAEKEYTHITSLNKEQKEIMDLFKCCHKQG